MNKKQYYIAALFAIVAATSSKAGSEKFTRLGDVLQVAIPMAGLGYALKEGDREGARQVLEGAVYTSLATHALKRAVGAPRPNGSDNMSFPSGHTAAATQGAAFIYYRYGPKYGIPAFGAAAVVGASRVNGDYHNYADIAAGMLLATGVQYLVSKKGWSVFAAPTADGFSFRSAFKF